MDWILSILSMVMLFMMGRKWKWAPLLGIGSQILWFIYAINLGEYGLTVGVVGYTVVHSINLYKWLKSANTISEEEEKNSEDKVSV